MIASEKKALRTLVKSLKKRQSEADRLEDSVRIFKQVEQSQAFTSSNTILLYWSMNDEVHTHDFINKWWQKKTILLPCVEGDNLVLRTFTGMASLKEGPLFNIPEPIGPIFTELDTIDLIIVPGIAFDKKNNRMGRGRGYYDKLLSLSSAYKMGVCFNFQQFDRVPVEAHDQALDAVIDNPSN